METTLHVARAAFTVEASARGPFKIHSLESWRRRHTTPALPPVVAELKERICATHRTKYFAFSLLEMKKIATPPVQIPATYRRRATAVVGGHRVPLTRRMWRQRQRPVQLPRILESADDEPMPKTPTDRHHTRSRRRSSTPHAVDHAPIEAAMVWVLP